MSWESFSVLFFLWTFVIYRRQCLSERLARAEARVRAEPVVPLLQHRGQRLPWQ